MSKLDDMLSKMKVEEYGLVPQADTKQQIKALMLDLINASDAYVATGSDNGVWRSDKDLRQKVNEL